MKEVKIHVRDGTAQDYHINGGKGTPISAFVLLASIRDEKLCQCLVYGNSTTVGKLLMTLYINCLREDPEGAHVIEEVAKDIVKHREAFDGRMGIPH